MGYEPTPLHRPAAIIRAFVPALPGSVWAVLAAEQVRTIPAELHTLLLSHHLTPLVTPPWSEFAHLFFGTVAPWFVNVVFDDRGQQHFTPPKLGTTAEGEEAPWLSETTRPAAVKFWTADVPNVLFTRPQGRPLSAEERDAISKYDIVVTDLEACAAAMESALGRRVHTSLSVALDDALRLATKEPR